MLEEQWAEIWIKNLWTQKKPFKIGNTTHFLVSHNILTNHTFDFQNSAIFASIHDKNKRRIIEACSLERTTHYHNNKVFFNITVSRENTS